MLVLKRNHGESVIVRVGDVEVKITVIQNCGKMVKLGFTCPPEVIVLREEIADTDRRKRDTEGGTSAQV